MPSPFTFSCRQLPGDDLRFESMTATQGLSTLDAIEVTLVSPRADIAAEKLLGEAAGVEVLLRDGSKRHFNGIVARFGMGRGGRGRHHRYHATIRPWLWFLTRTSDCRIFQDMTVPEIVQKVFGDHGAIASYELKLYGSYRRRVYCVQYRESDFQFVARLLEEEGIYWFFTHAENTHKLVLVDDLGALEPVEGAETLPFHALTGAAPPDVDFVSGWISSREVRTGKSVLTSYDFERPSTALLVQQEHDRSHPLDDYEQFDYQGEYVQKADGQHLVDVRLDAQQARFERASGQTNARALAVGRLFTLERHPRADQNAKYLCAQTQVSAHVAPYESGGMRGAAAGGGAGGGDADYQCQFTAAPASQVWRPERRLPKPVVQGPQTAVVVGPSGEEIFTDKYGRVKVQFHWDRYGQKNEKSSCWVRVSSPWAGKSFGFIQIPRIGQEVVVDFLEGDPDQPLITGRVYNAEQMPPWDLPANATQSGVLTRSSKGGAYGNANAIRFEDKKGSEQLWIHAEKNMDVEVENDETHWVGHDRAKTVDHDETTRIGHDRNETVANNETVMIGVNRTETVGSNHTETIGTAMSLTVGSTLTESIGVNHSETVGGAMELTVGGAIAITAGAAMAMTVGGVMSEAVGGAKSEEIGASKSVTVGANLSDTVGGSRDLTTGKGWKHAVSEDWKLSVAKVMSATAKKVQIVADDEISLKTGSAEIVLKKNGDITIKGGKIKIEGSGDVVLKGSKIKEN